MNGSVLSDTPNVRYLVAHMTVPEVVRYTLKGVGSVVVDSVIFCALLYDYSSFAIILMGRES